MSAASIPPPNFDVTAAYPEVGQLRAALIAQGWPAVRAMYVSAGWDGRSFFAGAVSDTPHLEPFLSGVLAQTPGDTVAGVLLGTHLIHAGWEVRSSRRAEHVSADQFATFHEYLRRAEQVLIDVTAREPGNVTAWTMRLDTARGLQLGQAETQRRYDQAARHDPHHVSAQWKMLQRLCPKWSGTWEEMFAFARQCVLAAPPGSRNGVILAEAHLERWLEYDDPKHRALYLQRADVQQEIREAAQRSAWHPEFRRTPGWVALHNTFAGLFSLMGDATAAAYHFNAVGSLASEHPWDYLGDPAKEFLKHRAKALAKAAKT